MEAFELPDPAHLGGLALRCLLSCILGGVLGFEREVAGRAAGLRTHMLVALGATVFMLAPREAGWSPDSVSRVLQGIVTGIGFVGAGAIMKLDAERRVKGVTTAASIWVTAALGAAVALDTIWLALLAGLLALAILAFLRRLEKPQPKDAMASDSFS